MQTTSVLSNTRSKRQKVENAEALKEDSYDLLQCKTRSNLNGGITSFDRFENIIIMVNRLCMEQTNKPI